MSLAAMARARAAGLVLLKTILRARDRLRGGDASRVIEGPAALA